MSQYIINEELSVSDEVLSATDIIVKAIIEESDNIEWQRKQIYNFVFSDMKEFQIELQEHLFETVNIVKCFIHDFDSISELNKLGDLFNIGAMFNQKEKTITLNIFSIKKEVNVMFMKTTLAHEIEHVFQSFKSGTNSFKELYWNTDKVQQNENNESIKRCLYYINETRFKKIRPLYIL